MVVNGGLRQGQTSTALMVLLLSTALFLIPGFRDQVSITVLLLNYKERHFHPTAILNFNMRLLLLVTQTYIQNCLHYC